MKKLEATYFPSIKIQANKSCVAHECDEHSLTRMRQIYNMELTNRPEGLGIRWPVFES